MIVSLMQMALSGRPPTRRALAALAKLCGWRVQRRWPFLRRARGPGLNLGFDDLLELQLSRRRELVVLVVGAFDGVTNDPTSAFIAQHGCRAIFVEPQPAAFARLQECLGTRQNVTLLNVAIDQSSGTRTMYRVPPGVAGLPLWAEQLASFDKAHLLKHEHQAPGLSQHIIAEEVATLTFDALLSKCDLQSLDVLQIDAEGFDAQLLAWFPFKRLKPALLHYEVAHMQASDHAEVSAQLHSLGYRVMSSDSPTDDMAFLF